MRSEWYHERCISRSSIVPEVSLAKPWICGRCASARERVWRELQPDGKHGSILDRAGLVFNPEGRCEGWISFRHGASPCTYCNEQKCLKLDISFADGSITKKVCPNDRDLDVGYK
jgi:hypothetical protein